MVPTFVVALVLALSALISPVAAPIAAPLSHTYTAAQATSYSLSLSKSSGRTSPVALQGQTVAGNIYVFVTPDTGATQVRFYLDNTAASGTPFQTENNAPYDFAGGSATAPTPYDTAKLSNGSHSITAAIDLSGGGTTKITSTFTVSNGVTAPTATPIKTAAPTVPAPTATKVPTIAPTATPTKLPATATPASSYSLSLSKAADRTNPAALQGQTVSGNIYVFLNPGSGASQVRFYLDNTAASGTPFQTENGAPYDFAGGSATAANPYNTAQLANGQHTITASADLLSGGTTKVTSTFTVNNAAATGTPVPTAQPTATPGVSGSIYWGVNMSGVPWDPNVLSAWERDVTGKAVSIINWGHFWGNSSGAYQNWSNGTINSARSHGAIPMISWTPEGGPADKWQLGDIINGTHDAYIRQFATDAKSWGFPFFLRIMHEMNGSWGYNWQETQNGNQRGQFVQAWRHIVDIFRQVGVSNASYVWCPNIDYPNTTNPSFASLYPGDSYVDWTCLDGYNWGSNRSSGWQSFDQVYSYSYNEILKIAPAKPMMIGEFGSVEQGGSKASWFTDALSTQIPGKYKSIKAAVYFNWQFDGVDWRVETSTAARDAWRKGIASSYYAADRFGSITGKIAVP